MSITKRTLMMLVIFSSALMSAAAQQEKKPENTQPATTKSLADKTAQDSAKKPGVHDAAYADPWVKFVKDASYNAPSGERILRHEVEIDYPVAKAWELFATASEGSTWMAPQFTLDLKTPAGSRTRCSATCRSR